MEVGLQLGLPVVKGVQQEMCIRDRALAIPVPPGGETMKPKFRKALAALLAVICALCLGRTALQLVQYRQGDETYAQAEELAGLPDLSDQMCIRDRAITLWKRLATPLRVRSQRIPRSPSTMRRMATAL